MTVVIRKNNYIVLLICYLFIVVSVFCSIDNLAFTIEVNLAIAQGNDPRIDFVKPNEIFVIYIALAVRKHIFIYKSVLIILYLIINSTRIPYRKDL